MTYTKEFSIETFEFWSGAKYVVNHYAEKGMIEELEHLIICRFEDCTPTETDINDFVWFEVPEIMEW